ncbi:MAG: beta-galactosidase [Victivallales bacterium]|nr:beta-galactosidase [Victivallales bacterium]
MKRLFALCALFCIGLLADYQIDFRKEDARQSGWTLTSGATQQGELTLVCNSDKNTASASRNMELNAYAGHTVRLTIEAKAEKVARGELDYYAAKVEFCAQTPWGLEYTKIQLPFGDSEWKTYEKVASFTADASAISLTAMVQKTTGTFRIRNIRVEVLSYALPISAKANMGLKDEIEGDGRGGWTDQGPSQDGRHFYNFLDKTDFAGIPFRVARNGKCVLVFKSDDYFPKGLPSADFRIPAPEKYRCLYLLHTIAWNSTLAGRVRVTDTAGKSHVFEVQNNRDVADWYHGKTELANARPVITALNAARKDTTLFASRFPIPNKLGPIASVRFESANKSIWMVLGATLTKADIPLPEIKFVTIKEDDEWRPAAYDFTMRVQPGSILDRAPYFLDKSVDELGRIIIRDSHFWYEKDPQRRAVFQVNAFHPTQLQYFTHKDCEDFVDELARNGYNMIRPHFLDEGLLIGAKEPLQFNEKVWDNFEYIVSLCRKRGIYIMFDAMTSWLGYTPGSIWSNAGRDPLKAFKWRISVDPAIRENWSKGVEKIIMHKNKYTGKRLVDDPILALVITYNEQEFGFQRPFVAKEVAPFWHDFLKKKYGTIEKLNKAWGDDANFKSFEKVPVWSPSAYAGVKGNDVALCLYELEGKMLGWCISELRRFGYKGLITGYNCGKSMRFNMLRRNYVDFVSTNTYASHPVNGRVSQVTPSSTALLYMRQLPSARLVGRPFIISEHNVVFWNKYRYEQAFGSAAFSAYQDFEAITVHAEAINLKKGDLWSFRIAKDPVLRACEYLTYFLLVRRDVQPARAAIRVRVKEDDVFAPNGPKGGFPSNYSLAALFSKISLECIGRDGKTIPLQPNEFPIKLDKTSAVTVGQGFMDIKENENASAASIVAEFKKRGLLSDKNRSDGVTYFESDTDELYLDTEKSFMQVNTPRFQGICGLAGTTSNLPSLKIHKMTTNATLCLVSVDGEAPLSQSRRMALVFATNALNSGMSFQGEDMSYCIERGTQPTLIQCGQFEVSITNKNAAKLTLYPLDFAGKRLKQIKPLSVQGDTARFAVDMRNDGHAFFYELSMN